MKDGHAINWFDIQVKDFDTAKAFYSTIIGAGLVPAPNMDTTVFFPCGEGKVGGSLSHVPDTTSGNRAVIVYLNGGDDLQEMLDRVEGAGGKIVSPKNSIGPDGFIATFEDPEGNVIGLHSPN